MSVSEGVFMCIAVALEPIGKSFEVRDCKLLYAIQANQTIAGGPFRGLSQVISNDRWSAPACASTADRRLSKGCSRPSASIQTANDGRVDSVDEDAYCFD